MFDNFLASVLAAATVAGGVSGAFWKYEDVASPEAKLKVTHWLRHDGPTTDHQEWADHLVVAFNKIFGARHFSLKCFFRSCLASVIAVAMMFLIWVVHDPEGYSSYIAHLSSINETDVRTLAPPIIVIFGALLFNSIPDYFSYMKTRVILNRITRSSGIVRLLSFVALDTGLSLLITIVAIELILWIASDKSHLVRSLSDFSELFSVATMEGQPQPYIPPGILTYTALFVSAWCWLYALSALATRFMFRLFPQMLTKTTWFFDVDGHPLRSLGCIAGGIVFMGILAAKAAA
jgi:hypothetical protein